MKVGRFSSVEEMVNRLDPSYPIYCFYPDRLRAAARTFIDGFPGRVLYAVKCNPHPYVVSNLWKAGIRHFDTASLREIAEVRENQQDANCYFNHPVKSRAAIDSAYKIYDIDTYVVDHINELNKLVGITGNNITVQVRLATAAGFATYDLSAKFGASEDDVIALLRRVKEIGATPAMSFHVGSQCNDPKAYAKAMKEASDVARRAGVELKFLNIGGGFPGSYRGMNIPPLEEFFDVIRDAKSEFGLADTELFCEPGRALVWDSSSVVSQIHLRKGNQLYLNDGVYGCMFEVKEAELTPPVKVLRKDGGIPEDPTEDFLIFGPTCDSYDQLPKPFRLPTSVREMDWIEIDQMGAYSFANMTSFNGFDMEAFAEIVE